MWSEYRPWKGFTVWIGGTALCLVLFGFGQSAALWSFVCLLAALVWAIPAGKKE